MQLREIEDKTNFTKLTQQYRIKQLESIQRCFKIHNKIHVFALIFELTFIIEFEIMDYFSKHKTWVCVLFYFKYYSYNLNILL